VRQRPFVFEHLAKVAHIDPAVAARTANEMLGFSPGRLANTHSNDIAPNIKRQPSKNLESMIP
jgi:hypothetical protein